MQFRLSTLLLGLVVVAASLGLAGGPGIIAALYGFVLVWLLRAAQRAEPKDSRYLLAASVCWMVLGCGGGVAWLASEPAWQARQSQCHNHLKLIGVGLLNYYDIRKSFPPLGAGDEEGRPLLSWRVLLVPYQCNMALYQQFDLSQSWDGPNNKLLAASRPWLYACPEERVAGSPKTETNYLAVTGPGTFWDQSTQQETGKDYPPPNSRKIAVVEVVHSGIAWTEPRDLTLEQALAGVNPSSGLGVSSRHELRGAFVLFGDGLVEFLPEGTPPELLKKLLTEGYDAESLEQLRGIPPAYRTIWPHDVPRLLVWIIAVLMLLFHGLAYDRRIRSSELKP